MYAVTCTITDNAGGADTTNTESFTVCEVNSIITGPIETSEGSTITLDGTSSTTFGGIIASYSRVIDSKEVGTSPTYTLAAEDDGIIEVSLTVTNNPGCMDSTPARGTTRSSSARRWRCYDSTSTR